MITYFFFKLNQVYIKNCLAKHLKYIPTPKFGKKIEVKRSREIRSSDQLPHKKLQLEK